MKTSTESWLSPLILRYLDLKKALGRVFAVERRVLETLGDFVGSTAAADLTQCEFERWCKTHTHLTPGVRRNRMRIVRNFCLYRRRTEPNCFVPDLDGFPHPHQPVQPYIFSETEIVRLLQATTYLRPVVRCPLRRQFFRVAIVLLYTAGLRRGELLRLTLQDYDPEARTLFVRESKFHKSRYLPLSADARRELEAYLAARRQYRFPKGVNSPLLWNGYAIHSFFRYVALEEPAHALHCQRILAVPNKRHVRKPIEFLNREEIDALLAVPNRSTWIGRRDRTLILVAVQTGLRVSELIGLNYQDVVLGRGAYVRCLGKGRKLRCTPLRPETARMVGAWLRERHGRLEDPVFPSIRGSRLSRDAIECLLTKYAYLAARSCPSLKRKKVTPHVCRHAAAMDLLHHGVDRSVIALWLGHESPETTNVYLHADMRLKEKALSCTEPLGVKPTRYRPDDNLLAFLEGL